MICSLETGSSEHVPIITNNAWTGDVWKVGFELAQSVDIEFKMMKIDLGVGVVKPKNENPFISDLTESLSEKRFSYFQQNVCQLPLASI